MKHINTYTKQYLGKDSILFQMLNWNLDNETKLGLLKKVKAYVQVI